MLQRASAVAVVLVAAALAGCALEPEATEQPVVQPDLVMPLEVYPGQRFVIDASASSLIGPGRIEGYEFVFDRDGAVLRVRDPQLEHAFDTPGVHVVELRLSGHEARVEQTLRVVDCDAPLACEPLRPCPPWSTCDNGRCVPSDPLCTDDADCPAGLRCVQGACGGAAAACPP